MVYDVVPVIKGVAADLSHMDTDCKVSGYCDPLGSNSTEQLDLALKGECKRSKAAADLHAFGWALRQSTSQLTDGAFVVLGMSLRRL